MDLEIMLKDDAAMDVDHFSAAGLSAPSLLAAGVEKQALPFPGKVLPGGSFETCHIDM